MRLKLIRAEISTTIFAAIADVANFIRQTQHGHNETRSLPEVLAP
jgi:hypothetical protein